MKKESIKSGKIRQERHSTINWKLIVCVVLLFCLTLPLAACSGNKMNAEQNKACDLVDAALDDILDSFTYYSYRTERRVISDTAVLVIHLTHKGSTSWSSGEVNAIQSFVEEAEYSFTRDTGVKLAVFFYGKNGDCDTAMFANDIPESVVEKLQNEVR